jgi:hypothetical protein
MEQVFKNEINLINKYKHKRGIKQKIAEWVIKKKMKLNMDLVASMSYEMKSDNEAIIYIETGFGWLVDDSKIVISHLKKYEKIGKGNVHVELIDDGKNN